MIFLIEKNVLITEPKQIDYLSVEERNYIYSHLNKGEVIFKFPKDFKTEAFSSNNKFSYKIGFIYDCLTILYPDMNKSDKYLIISEMYHFFFTYRRFKDKLDQYNLLKKKIFKV